MYDASGNVLQLQQNLGPGTVTTVYTYDAANQLDTAQLDGTTWQYTYDANGSLTEILPNGNVASGAKRYTYNAANNLVQVEAHNGAGWAIQAEMGYNGLEQRLSMDAAGVIAHYVMDGDRPLTAETGGNTNFYLYGLGAIGEKTTAWNYSLPDGSNTPRQLSDISGDITRSSRYTPWGDTLDTYGTGNFTFGYFGGVMDAATGLLYVGNGQYYDPATGRFLTRDARPDNTNPYVPWNPIGAIVGPLGVVALLFGRKRKGGRVSTFLVLLIVLGSVGITLAACGPTPSPTPPPPIPPTIPPSDPTPSPEPSPTSSGLTAYLTFDDGPDPYAYTFEIASVLNSRNVKATFFLTAADQGGGINGADFIRLNLPCADIVGNRDIPNANPDLLQVHAINAMGHAIGLHGLYHVGWNTQLDHGLYQLTEEERLLNQLGITLSEPVMVRTPYLGWGQVPIPGYKSAFYYDADIVSDDDKGLSAEQIVNSVASQLQNKGYPNEPIILLHSTNTVNTYETIVNPRPDIDLIAKLQELGYTTFKVLPRKGDTTNRIIGTH